MKNNWAKWETQPSPSEICARLWGPGGPGPPAPALAVAPRGARRAAATVQQRLPDLNFLRGEKSRSSGKRLRRKFVSLQVREIGSYCACRNKPN